MSGAGASDAKKPSDGDASTESKQQKPKKETSKKAAATQQPKKKTDKPEVTKNDGGKSKVKDTARSPGENRKSGKDDGRQAPTAATSAPPTPDAAKAVKSKGKSKLDDGKKSKPGGKDAKARGAAPESAAALAPTKNDSKAKQEDTKKPKPGSKDSGKNNAKDPAKRDAKSKKETLSATKPKKNAADTRKSPTSDEQTLAAMKAMIQKGALGCGGEHPMTVLMVAEKPSIADSIAKALAGNSGAYKMRGGKTPVHEFPGQFEGQPCVYRVTSVTGHIYSCDFPPEYSNWDTVEPVTLFTAPTMKKMESTGVFKQLQSEAKGADVLVLWLDCDREIESFVPKPYWVLDVEVAKAGHTVKLEWERGRQFSEETAVAYHNTVKEAKILRVVKVKRSETTRPRPTPLNTVNMLQHASKALGMGPYTAMQVAERLYLQGYISYPRTESTSYPDSYDIRGTLAQHTANPYWGSYVQGLLHAGYQQPKKGVDVGDHPPITPVRPASPSDLAGDMGRLYDFIARYFIATVSPDAKLLATKVQFTCAGENFCVTGHQVLHTGFTAVMPSATLGETLLPEFVEEELLPLSSIAIRRAMTTPPGYLTESELIGLMEKHGIGTDASIPAHINNICERNYVQLGAGRSLVPTPLGVVLARGYHKVDPELVLPTVRASIEQQCTLIAKGVASKQDVLERALAMFKQKFEHFVSKIALMDALFLTTFSPLEATGKPLSKCGKCLRYMKYVSQRPQRLHCAACDETYQLPQNGTIKLYKELRCPVDNFEMVLFSLGNSERAMGKSYPLCPHCYNHPPFEGMQTMGCDQCLHPTCRHSLTVNGVFPCPGALDKTDAPPCSAY
ncbi:hypothetical protein ATCC90586_000529 [Pythium insidiosum]|nr:hypothetical protein ATCC90586_000529 [Pythium insidiosum]